jgi:hypothetical protein
LRLRHPGRPPFPQCARLQACNAWVPPTDSGYQRAECSSVAWGNDTLSKWGKLRGVDVLMGHHGAGLTNGFMMTPGSSLVEIRMHTCREVSPPSRPRACQPAGLNPPVLAPA